MPLEWSSPTPPLKTPTWMPRLAANCLADRKFFDPCDGAVGEEGSVVTPEQVANNGSHVGHGDEDQRVSSREKIAEGKLECRALRSIRGGEVLH